MDVSESTRDGTFDVEKFSSKLETSYVGRRMVYTKVTGTTMDDAREDGLRGCPDGTIHLAETQTKARGYKNHSWNALNTGNLYFSIILYRPKAISDEMNYKAIFDTELVAGLSLLQVASDLRLDNFCLKWPNDVWVKGRKVAGILLEDAGLVKGAEGEERQLYILGMGINVNSDMRRHPELYGIATSVRCENRGGFIDREEMMASFCGNLERLLKCDHDTLYDMASKSQLFDKGLRVRVTEYNSGQTFPGVMKNITSDWMVTIQDDNGKLLTKSQYDFSLRPIPSKKILVYNGDAADQQSANGLLAMFQSLVDLVQFSIENISDKKLQEGNIYIYPTKKKRTHIILYSDFFN
ncbi:hypothetical protein FSP39_015379 [Pinctada imbricata]|uniref:BPL/LPL catalytic domain-containing protein n=1 Tax=Pinctada imbricata TaxID=66713 RepID=A0AA88YDR9_PINIB|nr:hypothetical protein FSP39_015379 [Pinctada imbricata]